MQDTARGFIKLHHLRLAHIENMDEEVGHHRFFQGGIEGLDQSMRQLPDESHSVGEQEWLIVRQRNLARRCVECGEKFVLHEHLRAGERTQQRRFASVGVADDSGIGHRGAFAVLALRGTAPLHSLQLTFQAVDLATDFPFVLLELGLALALGPDAATLFAKV